MSPFPWPCGVEAKAALRRLVRTRAVVCTLPETAEVGDSPESLHWLLQSVMVR